MNQKALLQILIECLPCVRHCARHLWFISEQIQNNISASVGLQTQTEVRAYPAQKPELEHAVSDVWCLVKNCNPGVSKLLASLGHTEWRRVVLGHTVNTLQHVITKNISYVLSKFTTLCWVPFVALLSCMWPVGCGCPAVGSVLGTSYCQSKVDFVSTNSKQSQSFNSS